MGGRNWIFALAVTLLQAVAWAAPTLSSAPFIYVIDYSDRWVKDPKAVETLGPALPDVLHIGKAVPITHNWGPIPYMAGENQDTGGKGHTLNRDSIRLLSPQELEEKAALIKASVARLHEAGVPLVLPYICYFSMAGDHESRQGLWAFYDRWSDYERWLGPRPETDPADWMMRDLQGKRIDPGYGYTPPYFAPLHRYGACPNNPGWNQFSCAIVRLIAGCGYDGTFVDNSCYGGDGCAHCRAAFAKWVTESFSDEALRRFCGVEDIGPIELPNANMARVVSRWHMAVLRDRLAMLRRAGQEVKPGFLIFPNSGGYQRTLVMGDGCDLCMFENIQQPGCLVTGEVPEDPGALVTVRGGAPVSTGEIGYNATHESVFSEVTAQISYPQTCPPGRPAPLSVNVLTVGASNEDGDCLEALALRLTNLTDGSVGDVTLGPEPGVGDPRQVDGARRPPLTLTGEWVPRSAGSYAVDICYKYTDAEHRDVADHVPVSDRLGLGSIYRVDLGGLGCTYNSRCKTIALVENVTRKGLEAVQELCLAEGAAAGGRYSVHTNGETRTKYGRFFHTYGRLAAGLQPYGSATLLYSYWGPNPGEVGRNNTRSVHEYLSSQHVLYRTLVDRDLDATDLEQARSDSLVLVCPAYELTDAQITSLREYVRAGGRLVVENPDTTINFRPIAQVLGLAPDSITPWDWQSPPTLGPALLPAKGALRGVRFTAFAEPGARPGRVVLHAVNYNVSLVGESPGQVTPMEGLAVTVPVPEHWTTATARVFDPDGTGPQGIACTVEGGMARLELPALRVYQMIELNAGQGD